MVASTDRSSAGRCRATQIRRCRVGHIRSPWLVSSSRSFSPGRRPIVSTGTGWAQKKRAASRQKAISLRGVRVIFERATAHARAGSSL